MPDKDKVLSPRFAAMLNKRLTELGITRSDFIRKLHKEYGKAAGSRNHLFRLLNGGSIVGERGLLPMIVKSLDLDIDEALKLVRTDKIAYKEWAYALPKANKTVQDLATVMESLSKRDQEDVLRYAKMRGNLL